MPVWLIVIGVHVVLLLASLVFKHNHAEIVAVKEFADVSAFPREQWFTTNGWMFAANSTGTISLLVAMVVFTNAI